MTAKASPTNERDEAIAKLREILRPGDTVYTILRHVSRSGMRRHIGCVVVCGGEARSIDHWVALATGRNRADIGGSVVCNGAGMDMGWDLVYSIDAVLWPVEYDRTGAPIQRDRLRHRWL